ncbi:MAG: hypothetical protein ACOCUI_03370 [bacterium]
MNSKWHMLISFTKSIIRIVGCIYCIVLNISIKNSSIISANQKTTISFPSKESIIVLGICLLLAEILGILEEVGDKR